MKREALDPVNEGDNVNTNLADADIANASDNANLPAPTSMGLASQNVNTSPDAVHGQPTATATQDAASASAAAAPFGGRLRVRDPFSGRLVRVPQMRPSVHAQELARSCESPHYILFIDILTNLTKALPDSAPRYELSSGAMRP
ncbi:uncharacterized protein CCOS01_09596 [Colletotrichum costaricense]|uniref:Uncharacterized protein n=1 Tax=Colletotrichum costaricense TaxID=1209916 RepID=A0AAI9YVK6_9PEZI|nr:uncharacterized protein CCOS01_09596 [Colletotrichum costaricense]KAK1524509.1 hypothetical protein CCOS01_09596 [Colletotrichum costaricense]